MPFATSAGFSSRCTGGAVSATTCSRSGQRRSSRSTRALRRSTHCSTARGAWHAANAARRSCAGRGSARTAAGPSPRTKSPRSSRPSSNQRRSADVASSRERAEAIAAAEGVCPRCGTPRKPDQRYCLECGLSLPEVSGRLPSLRRRWIQRVGWYPGDWVWVSLLTLLVAVLGAAAAILLTEKSKADTSTFAVPPPVVSSVAEPTTVPTATTTPATVDTTTLPVAPEPTTTKTPRQPKNGRVPWPANENGWTIVLVSYPKTNGHDAAFQTSARAAKAGLQQVGVLDSSRYASLQPGYYVVFTGIYGSRSDADAGVATARQAGFGGSYSRQIAK